MYRANAHYPCNTAISRAAVPDACIKQIASAGRQVASLVRVINAACNAAGLCVVLKGHEILAIPFPCR